MSESAASSARTLTACTLKGKEPKKAASHNTPVTVAAETGLVGLALFVALLGAMFAQALRRADRSLAGVVWRSPPASLLAAILCHSLFYADFFEDPTTWVLFGLIGLAALVRPASVAEEPPPAAAPREAVPV